MNITVSSQRMSNRGSGDMRMMTEHTVRPARIAVVY